MKRTRSLYESERILGSKWVCTVCNGVSWIKRDGDGYRITCIQCGKSAWGARLVVGSSEQMTPR